MKATEVNNWKTLNNFVYDRVSGKDNSSISESDVEFLKKKSSEVFSNLKIEEIVEDVETVMKINVLDKKADLSIFELVPEIWRVYYGVALGIFG